MAKKLLALLLAMCMLFSVCSVSVFAEDPTGEEETTEATTPEEESSQEETEEESNEEETTDETVEKSVNISLANSYYPNDTVVVKGTVTGDVSVVRVEIICEDDRVDFSDIISASKFKSSGLSFNLEDASVGAEYSVTVYDDDTDEELGSDSFLIRKSNTSTSVDDGSNKVTIWIEGLTERYIEETVVNLDNVKEPTVLEVAEYVLEEVDREYKSSKVKVTAIASTATGTTYTLKDNSTNNKYEDCQWAYILNGEMADYDGDWTDIELKGGDEVVLFYGVPGEVGYPVVTVTPEMISVKDEVTITVKNRLFDEDGEIESEEPVKGAKVYLLKRGSTSKGTAKTTNADGEYVFKSSTVTSSWITSYQGGEVMVGGYQTSSKPLTMVTVKEDLITDREGTIQAYVRIEGAHKTLLKRTKSAKIDEFDLYNFMVEVLEDEDIEYETNDNETNFTYFESKSTSGYSNENGDIVRDSGWYVAVNDEVYTPDDDLEEVEIYPNDEILFYFGDEDTVPVVYCKIDGDLETEKKVYAYFYSDADMTNPIDDFDVYFDGDEYSDKRLNTNSDGRVTLPTVEYRGTYTLSWGEQVAVKADECPYAISGSVELKYTGASASVNDEKEESTTKRVTEPEDEEFECENCGKIITRVYTVEYKGKEYEVCKSCQQELEAEEWTTAPEEDETWKPGEYETVPNEEDTFVPGPSKYYPDTNIDKWAVANVNKAYEYDLMSGTGHGYFEPKREITRAEFTTIVCRILGLNTDASAYEQKFADVSPSDWHYGYVMAAFKAGYVNGMSETIFAPSNYITREEIAVMVSRILNVTGEENDALLFADGASISKWARIYVAAVNKTGIMTGDQFGQFLPKNKVDRQTVATIAVRLYEYLGKN